MEKESWLRKYWFIVLLLALAAGGADLYFWQAEQQKDEQAKEQAARIDLSRLTMAEALTRCRTLWTSSHYDQNPLAIAWSRQGVDWYVLDGVDTASMRHYSCNGNEVSRGLRYVRVMARHVPKPTGEPRNIMNDRNLFAHYAALPNAGLRGLEATEHPITRALVERRWPANGAVQSTWPDQNDFPLLFSAVPADLTAGSHSSVVALPAPTNWLKQPTKVFALLEKQLPPQTRYSEIDFDEKSIKITVVGPIKNFDGKPPAAFGDATFDDYGVRDASWWYPRDKTDKSCVTGRLLNEIREQFSQNKNATATDLYRASFGCGATGGASWTLRVPRRRQ